MITVTFFPDPLSNRRRETWVTAHKIGARVIDLIRSEPRLKNSLCRVFVNDLSITFKEAQRIELANGDVIAIKAVAQDPISTALAFFFVDFGIFAGFEVLVASFVVGIAQNIALGALLGAISGGGSSNNNNGNAGRAQKKEAEVYGISGGSNSFRPGSPYLLTMGKTRVFPDYGGRWFTDYPIESVAFNDFPGWVPVSTTLPVYNLELTEPTTAPWPSIAIGDVLPPYTNPSNPASSAGQLVYYFDNLPRAYLINGITPAAPPHTFVIRWTSPANTRPWSEGAFDVVVYEEYEAWLAGGPAPTWVPYTPGMQLPAVTAYSLLDRKNTQRLSTIFNYGFGDLNITGHYIGTNPVANYTTIEITRSNIAPGNSGDYLPDWYHANADQTTLTQHPSDVESVQGGVLKRPPGVIGDWVTRRANRKQVEYIEVDIIARLFVNTSSGPTVSTFDVTIQYRDLSAPVAWVTRPPLQLSNGTTSTYRLTVGWAVPPGEYEVRLRAETEDSTTANDVKDVNAESLKFFSVEPPPSTYSFENRVGVVILSGKETQGALDRWSSLVEAKCFVQTQPLTYTGALPVENLTSWSAIAGSNSWSWSATTNPAWWFLYFAMGGFVNKTIQFPPLLSKNWMCGEASGNGLRMFGVGLPNSQIDFVKIVQWSIFCQARNLQFGALLQDGQKPCVDVLKDIARVGRATVTWSGGKLGVAWMQADDLPVQMFGMGNIVKDTFSISYLSSKTPDRVELSFADEADDYSPATVYANAPGIIDPITSAALKLWGVQTKPQAQREARLIAAEQTYRTKRISFETAIEGMVCAKWDVINLAHDLTSWGVSGRLTYASADGVKLDQNLEASVAPRAFTLRMLNGSLATFSMAASAELPAGSLIQLSPALTAAQLPYSADLFGGTNAASPNVDSVPEDFVYSTGKYAPSKRCRVLSVEPQSSGNVKIVCSDETLAYYAYEFDPPTLTPPEQASPLTPIVFNAGVVAYRGGWRLVWELTNAASVSLASQVIGSGTAPSWLATVNLYQDLGQHPSGTTIQFTIYPEPLPGAPLFTTFAQFTWTAP